MAKCNAFATFQWHLQEHPSLKLSFIQLSVNPGVGQFWLVIIFCSHLVLALADVFNFPIVIKLQVKQVNLANE